MEIAYIPCLAYPAGEMKHGPIALLEDGSPVVVILPNDKHREKTITSMHECRARGAKIILIHEEETSRQRKKLIFRFQFLPAVTC